MLASESSSGYGAGRPSRIARENSSAWIVNWSAAAMSIVQAPEPPGSGPVVHHDPGGLVSGCVEWDLHLDPPARAQDVHPLPGHELRAARTDGVRRPEVQEHGRQAIDVGPRVGLDRCRDAPGLALEHHARGVHQIASDVEQPAAAALGQVANVRGIVVEVAEEPGDRADLAEPAGSHGLLRGEPLRMRPDHEGLLDPHTRPVARVDQLPDSLQRPARPAFRTARACRRPPRESSRARAGGSAGDCRRRRCPGRRGVPRRNRKPWPARAPRPPRAPAPDPATRWRAPRTRRPAASPESPCASRSSRPRGRPTEFCPAFSSLSPEP